ncbi:hypothetical protein [Halosimplex pelagicum]|uniref:Uncharacterized protein n=1 Tax=Halosimplex pelagicum TaxID=869886 RepID=A0A7D5TDG1_9EURY|nr:hypothetical protein [Halosimplex pelagicum]QLH83015.1 hypothetical protein HZS54_15890 [Halosimplex pelagicum]
MSHTRRQALRSAGILIGMGLAGCSEQQESTAQLGDLQFVNKDESVHTVVLSVHRESDPVFMASYDIPMSKSSTTTINEGWPTDPGQYSVVVALSGQNNPESIELVPDGGCQSLLVEINNRSVSFFGPAQATDSCTTDVATSSTKSVDE